MYIYIYIYTTIHTPLHSHLGCLNPHIHTIGFANFMYWLAKSSLLLVKPLIATDIPELTRLDPPIPIVSHDFHSSIGFCGYPLVNIQKNWWENHHFQWVNPLWMAMFNSYVSHYQRVSPMFRATLIFSPWKKIAENYLSHKQISCLGSNAPCFTILQVIYHWLVVSTPLKRDDYSQYMENKKCSKPPTSCRCSFKQMHWTLGNRSNDLWCGWLLCYQLHHTPSI